MNIFTKINGFILALICICHASPALAQGQDANFKWVGNDISTVVNSSNPDMNTVYLYNVGTGKYLNVGSYWGTSVSAYNVGMPITITKNGSNYYRMRGPIKTPQGENIAFGRRMDTNDTNSVSWNRVYCDRGTEQINGHVNGILDWTFTKVGSENTYTIHCNNDETGYDMHGKRYLHVSTSASNSNRLDLDYPSSITDDNGRWKIVTLKDLKDAFKEKYASEEDPADATFLIKNQNFSRSNKEVESWVKTGFTSHYTNQTNFLFDPASSYTYYVGMGCQNSDGYQTQYGRYWIGSVRNLGNTSTRTNGTLIQEVTVLKAGWYKVSCDGFYATTSSTSNMKSELVAYVSGQSAGSSSTSVTLNKFKKEFTYTRNDLTHVYTADDLTSPLYVSPYIKAAQLFEEAKYENSVMVYVPNDGNKLNIGIKISGSDNELDWTAFDNFQLKYCGNYDLVLDEAQQSVDYMTQQKDEYNSATLILKRSIKADTWNSITLPVNLTVGQFKTAFGNQAKLSVLKGTDPNRPTRIVFKSVDLTNDDAVAIEAGKLYIMKPVQEANVTSGTYGKTLKDNSKITVNAPYFVINNVTLKTVPQPIIKEDALVSHNPDVKIQFCGVMINHTGNIVPKYSYVLGGTDGKWYYTQSDLPIKGFRTYIATGGAAGAQALTFAIDDEDFGDITGINGIGTDEETGSNLTVYNLNGQVVRSGSSSLEGLPKGIYIINHKKVIVK